MTRHSRKPAPRMSKRYAEMLAERYVRYEVAPLRSKPPSGALPRPSRPMKTLSEVFKENKAATDSFLAREFFGVKL